MSGRLDRPFGDRLRYTGYALLGGLVLVTAALALAVFRASISPESVNSLSTILLVTITGIYAFLTWMLVVENRRARRERHSPSFVVEADIFGPRIRNVGNGPARDLEITLTLVSDDDRVRTVVRRDGLVPDDDVWVSELPFAAIGDELDDVHDRYESLEVNVSFEDMFGRPDSRTLTYTTETLIADESRGSPDQRIANNLEKINTTLERALDDERETREQDDE
jgi:hypothetical protein